MAIKLIAFDWNGTLLSDTRACWEGANQEFKAAGVKPISLQRWRQTFVIPYIECLVQNGVDRKFGMKNSKKLAYAFHTFYELRAAKCRTRSGAKEILTWLKNHKINSMIFSNHTMVGIEAQLKRLKIRSHMDVVLANDTQHGAVHNKNKGQKLNSYVKTHNYKPKQVVVIGDTPEEIDIGRQYGFYTVGITGGYNTTKMLKTANPDFLIHNMLELKKIVQKLNKY